MRPDIGRFLEGRLLDTIQLIKTVYDVGSGAGHDVTVWFDGREMVFGKGPDESGRGFLRLIAGEVSVVIAFPRGGELFDPQKRARGYAGSQTSMTIGHIGDLDSYVRRMIAGAYTLEE